MEVPMPEVVKIQNGAEQVRVTQQYANRPLDGVVVAVEQRTTGAGRSVLLSPLGVRELRDALTGWLESLPGAGRG